MVQISGRGGGSHVHRNTNEEAFDGLAEGLQGLWPDEVWGHHDGMGLRK